MPSTIAILTLLLSVGAYAQTPKVETAFTNSVEISFVRVAAINALVCHYETGVWNHQSFATATNTMMGARKFIGGKGAPTDAGMHVPLIVSWPGKAASVAYLLRPRHRLPVYDVLIRRRDSLPQAARRGARSASNNHPDGSHVRNTLFL